MAIGSDGDDDHLAALVESMLAQPEPLDWRLVTKDDTPARWAELDIWVRWLVSRYAVDAREIPPCWYRHGSIVEELTALRGAHAAAHDASSGPSEWHYTFALTRVRLREYASRFGCRTGEHRDDPEPTWPGSDYQASFEEHIRRDAETRG